MNNLEKLDKLHELIMSRRDAELEIACNAAIDNMLNKTTAKELGYVIKS